MYTYTRTIKLLHFLIFVDKPEIQSVSVSKYKGQYREGSQISHCNN